ncbi:putative formamidopyrimidine DNA glycosylase [Suhomyces tanzawaensis NRRL Y-17324]|uniref:Putative formamidopyrimidine DNA glycosylase n=1 Tax=Suhomyces tanzawaensis NRRL Y-17324 TaxID=984487 RepID=A0A1E4SQU7_9ASCO|nr:putative formamidopyrimidine DNA glycosylase [Suhomyces tanzawaensis NRRL Y-17324]ODV81879.1 putative formamidopyrimidine DNA glycosylase [Suhomyces tanzawaensis NRRL Y-17324]
MPEVAEVAHVVALLRRNILGSRIVQTNLKNDALLFPLLKGSATPEDDLTRLQAQLTNAVIRSVGRHGKYFWIRIQPENSSQTGVLLMHFGMTGMIKLKDIYSHMVFMENGGDKKVLEQLTTSKYFAKGSVGTKGEVKEEIKEEVKEITEEVSADVKDEEWPPRFSKMELVLQKEDAKIDLAFVDPRRLGRVRFLTGDNVQTDTDLLLQEPLSALGPDYSKPGAERVKTETENGQVPEFVFGDPDPYHHGRPRLELEEFNRLVLSKKKPIKSLLLDQGFFAGVGNWLSDEICYHARLHPSEILSLKIEPGDEVSDVITKLYQSLVFVCEECVRVEGDTRQFPTNWLMLHRWGKARKKQPKARTSDGYEVDHVTVGGRTSCFVPELQQPLVAEPTKKRRKT